MVSLLLALRLGVGACGESAEATGPPQRPPAAVEVATVEGGELLDEWVFLGEARSLHAAELALGAGGEVVMLEVREGERVEEGALLVEIDGRSASARVSAAVSSRRESQRELEQARLEADRAASLGGEVLASEDIERGRVRADTLEARGRRYGAEIRAAKAQLSDYRLLAPFAGVIAARRVDLGQWVDPGQTVLELVSTEAVEVLVKVRPQLAPQLQIGTLVELRDSSGRHLRVSEGARAPAEVLGIVPALDPSTRTITVRVRPTQATPWLLPGAAVEVAFSLRLGTSGEGALAGAVIVPRDALVLGAVDTRVVAVVEGKARALSVEVIASAGDRVLVRAEGLEIGDSVVTRGNERLRPGQALQPIPSGGTLAGVQEDPDS